MFLKKIEIQGFKSFADKTEIEFKSGITGVVGPNGSGKSNISDSIRWVLGEQSVKTLRGSKMEDVIFSGTETRKSLGFAEVTLVLDNSEKDLPIEYSEVSVTRRVFRSGESEYYINKNACRLKDIRELFMDTGVGKDGYSIIGQGKIDEILSSKSEDRRNIFEEAAGIVKYKSRKEEAEKKLQKTDDNLIRINDIVEELEKQLSPLKIQSESALEYTELSESLKSLQINLYIREIEKVKVELIEMEQQISVERNKLNSQYDLKESTEETYTIIKEKIQALDENIDRIKNNRFSTKSEIDHKQNEVKLIREKLSFFDREIERFKRETDSFNDTISKIEIESQEKTQKKTTLSESLAEFDASIQTKQSSLKSLMTDIELQEKEIEDKRSDVLKAFNLMADKKSKVNSLNSFKQNIEKRITQLDQELSSLNDVKKNITNMNKDISEQLDKSSVSLKQKEESLKIILKDKNELSHNIENMTQNINQVRGEIHSKSSKHRVLNDMSREYEGYYKGVKNALKASEQNSELGKGVRGVLAELISVPKKYEKAVEVALGGAIQNIVTDSPEDAKVMIDYLKKNNLGRVTFLPRSSIKGRSLNPSEKKLLEETGVCGVGSEIVEYDSDYENILQYMLGRVIFVEQIEDGMKVAKSSNYSLKVVSLDGDVLNPGGSMTGGSLQNTNTKLLGRQREIEELSVELKTLEQNHNNLKNELEDCSHRLVSLEKEEQESSRSINDMKISHSTLENKSLQYQDEDNKNQTMIDKYTSEKKSLTSEQENILTDRDELETLIQTLKQDNTQTENHIETSIYKLSSEKEKRDQIAKEMTELRVSSASVREQHNSLENTLNRLNQEKIQAKSDIDKRESEQQTINDEIIVFSEHIKALLEEVKQFSEKLDSYDLSLNETIKEKENLTLEFKEQEEQLKTAQTMIYELEKSVNDFELTLEKSHLIYENYNNKLWDDYELSFLMAKKYRVDLEDLKTAENEVKAIKAKIKSLGPINLNAIEEYSEVSERFEFMNVQITDLNTAKDSLSDVIKDMNVKMREQFLENFEIIKANFIEVFEKLFGGGRADVYLEDTEDILASGIEIVAQPPGKKLQSLSLLSGGERALTAIALLFAIIKTKPTPFCILDEIEAALDEANVYRYAEYLREFSHSTQFIAITHRKGTMENVDSLYGVTMEEQGISKLVSIKLSDKEKMN